MRGFWLQVNRHSVALISLFIAVTSLAYNTWRNETTEHQRNIRHAAFLVLENVGTLQEVVDERYYYLPFDAGVRGEGGTRLRGYGKVAMIRDLTELMPPPAPAAGVALFDDWQVHFEALDELAPSGQHSAAATTAEEELTAAIRDVRAAIKDVLRGLE